MILENKYIIGTMVMFYELEAVKEFVQSVKNACLTVDNKENIATEFLLNTSEYSEKIDTNYTKEYLHDLFHSYCVKPLEEIGIKVILRYNDDATKLYSVGDYRRDLNYFHCKDYDFITWGEADCLMPKEYFEVMESVSNYANSSNINRYCLTFGVRKMWDSSWQILEHDDFTNCEYYHEDHPSALTEKSSIWYYMSIDEMNDINNKIDSKFNINMINYPRFDGSLVTISSEIVLGGINVPPAVPCCGEDTAFQNMISIIMGESYVQFIVKNILKVHNRNHPRKRMYIENEKSIENSRIRRDSNTMWKDIYNKTNYNLSILGANQNKFKKL